MSSPAVVVLGGGVGGVVAVTVLRERLSDDASITLVDEASHHTFKPTFLRLLTGERERSEATEPLAQFDYGPVSFLNARVMEIDTDGEQVKTSEGTVEYDYLVVALGVQYDDGAIPGIEAAHHVYTADGAEAYREALERFQGGELVLGVSSKPFICPAAPVEAALFTDYFLRKRGSRAETTMRFFFPGPGPMRKAGAEVSGMAIQALEGRGVDFHGHHALEAVDPDTKVLRFEDHEDWTYDLLFATPPHKPPTVVADSDLADETGWIPVDRHTMRTDADGVYAVGDNATVRIPTIGKPLPKAGVFARKQAEVAAHNVTNEVQGIDDERTFDGVGQCFLASKYGLNGQAGMVETDFFADPQPEHDIKRPHQSRTWHYGKLLYEESWHRKWFPGRGGEPL